MSATDAVALLDVLAVAGVGFWVNGGWGTDALVGHETRPHRDIDLFIERRHVRLLRDALGTAGLAEVPGGRAANFVLSDDKGREVDVHLFELDAAGNGLYPMSDGRVWLCQAEGLVGSVIAGKPVRCFTAALQLQCYSVTTLTPTTCTISRSFARRFRGRWRYLSCSTKPDAP
ncbi:MAG: aminoglycoside nucleotidyltransferase [Dehalococcoidia bacterium]|nr:aminoglycoside nucleotidyltransferase [Dehalococcoidia bacterium]